MNADESYDPSPLKWVRDQAEAYEASDGARANTIVGKPIVLITMRGARSGRLRKIPLMRVEHEGHYAAVASMGGQPENPVWYHNLKAHPRVVLQDGAVRRRMVAREVSGADKAAWWDRAVAAFPNYRSYQKRTTREIPVFVLEPEDG